MLRHQVLRHLGNWALAILIKKILIRKCVYVSGPLYLCTCKYVFLLLYVSSSAFMVKKYISIAAFTIIWPMSTPKCSYQPRVWKGISNFCPQNYLEYINLYSEKSRSVFRKISIGIRKNQLVFWKILVVVIRKMSSVFWKMS